MQHLDELLLWLAHTIVKRLDVQVMQFWTNHATSPGQHTLELQTIACQQEQLPEHIVVNSQVAELARRISEQRQHFLHQTVNNLFPLRQATLFKGHGLQYCSGYFLQGQTPAPLSLVALLFFQQSPSQKQLVNIEHILEHSLLIARNRQLLQPATNSDTGPIASAGNYQQLTPLALSQLIPRRIEEVNLMKSSNPFTTSVGIEDKQARRLYAAIDGQKNVAALLQTTHLALSEVQTLLQTLVAQQRIRLYSPDGQEVHS
jgi:hypothetical protein